MEEIDGYSIVDGMVHIPLNDYKKLTDTDPVCGRCLYRKSNHYNESLCVGFDWDDYFWAGEEGDFFDKAVQDLYDNPNDINCEHEVMETWNGTSFGKCGNCLNVVSADESEQKEVEQHVAELRQRLAKNN